MEFSDFQDVFDETDRDEDRHVSVDRANLTVNYLNELCAENDQVGSLTVSQFIEFLERAI